MELKSATPKSKLRYLRLLYFIPAIASLGCDRILHLADIPLVCGDRAIAGPIASYSIMQIVPLFIK
jgi:hypothetical protein